MEILFIILSAWLLVVLRQLKDLWGRDGADTVQRERVSAALDVVLSLSELDDYGKGLAFIDGIS